MSMLEQQTKAPPEIRAVVSFLRSSKAGMKNRVGVLNGKRIDYFKGTRMCSSPTSPHHPHLYIFLHLSMAGKSAIKALLSPAYAKLKNVPKVTSESEAQGLLHSCIPFAFFL